MIGGLRVIPAMGEIHYSRIPAAEWQQEVKQMKAGGITMLACYVFWNHIEEIEGQFDWSGQRNLRTFLEICKGEQMPVVLRIGPFCHGEARNGGIPDWVFAKGCKTRSEDKIFLGYTEKYYRQIFTQVQGLQWKDGGPVIAAQFDNEYRGHGSYLMALKDIAKTIGFELPFYTRTGWPELATPVPFGELIPLYGDYADGFWDRSIQEGVGDYYKAFNFHEGRSSTAIASEQLKYDGNEKQEQTQKYPYFTCELGGGMMTSYHRRVYLYPEDAYSMAVVKLGSGSNLLGYYMYHGGTNPEGKLTYLNETQKTIATNYNDLPVMTYDFQAPLNEFGQRNPHFYLLRKLHLFIDDYATELAPMQTVYTNPQTIRQGDDSFLRWSYREKNGSAFVFVNNYERFQNLKAKTGVQFEVSGVKFPEKPITIPANTVCIFPVNIDGIRYATAQLIARRDGKIYMEQIDGIATELAIDGKVLRNLKAKGTQQPVYKNIYLLDSDTAGKLFLDEHQMQKAPQALKYTKTQEATPSRTITIGANKVAEEPTDVDFEKAATYTIELPADHQGLLSIHYYGDCARLYDGEKLIDDNFYNGREFQYALWRLPETTKRLTLRILPIQKDMPVYFPREAAVADTGERIKSITVQYK
ncbi:MAG: beta-galactosidase [Bacteroidaceae bacterium]|nr:beta-galactosidase [Bacteroidaceae bacterium]